MKEKVFTFRIVEITHRDLEKDNKTITSFNTYKVYEKVPWYNSWSGWIELCMNFDDEFGTIEEAEEVARHYVHEWERDYMLDKKRKELKTTTKIIREFDVKPFE
jgi:hypothetical protein